jgi:hypothetical protein
MNEKSLPSLDRLKEQAKSLRNNKAEEGVSLGHSQCLELVAKSHGFKDWNCISAAASNEGGTSSYALGQRVSGHYLSIPFAGELVLVKGSDDPSLTIVRVKFDEAIDVVKFDSFSNFRRQVTCSLTKEGVTLEKTSI